MNEKVCIGEVGVDLEPCVHAHGPDVKLIIEASCNDNNPLVIGSSCIYVWSFAIMVPTILFFFDPILGQVEVLVFCRTIHLSNLYSALPSSIPSGISRISRNYITSYEFFINYYYSPDPIVPRFWVVVNRVPR